MQAGFLRNQVELQTNSPSTNGFGEQIASWTTVATVWASITPLSGREFVEAKAREVDATVRITIRYRSDMLPTPNWRVKFGSRYYDIDSVINRDERGKTVDLMCREVM